MAGERQRDLRDPLYFSPAFKRHQREAPQGLPPGGSRSPCIHEVVPFALARSGFILDRMSTTPIPTAPAAEAGPAADHGISEAISLTVDWSPAT